MQQPAPRGSGTGCGRRFSGAFARLTRGAFVIHPARPSSLGTRRKQRIARWCAPLNHDRPRRKRGPQPPSRSSAIFVGAPMREGLVGWWVGDQLPRGNRIPDGLMIAAKWIGFYPAAEVRRPARRFHARCRPRDRPAAGRRQRADVAAVDAHRLALHDQRADLGCAADPVRRRARVWLVARRPTCEESPIPSRMGVTTEKPRSSRGRSC